ncbi:MAG: hypothetical protein J1G06_01020 [Oscillospiraceae bacterium]|nr:hypothetical protein [Oscillospiraceae bacterium]
MKEQELKDALNRIEISDEARGRILEKSKTVNNKKGDSFMKSKKKFAIIAAAVAFVLGVTAFAVKNNITSMYSISSSVPDYTELPEAQQLVKDVGYAVDMVEEFSNGYSFDEGGIRKNVIKSDDTVEEFKSLSMWYTNGENKVILSIDKYGSVTQDKGSELAARNGDVDIYEYSFINKIVPEDYVKSAEELAAEESGKLSFAYDGENHIVETNIKSVSWTKDDIRYSLMQMDGELSTNELIAMANELIDQN